MHDAFRKMQVSTANRWRRGFLWALVGLVAIYLIVLLTVSKVGAERMNVERMANERTHNSDRR